MLACTLGLVTIAQKLPVELNCSCVVDFISIFIDNRFVFVFLLWFSCSCTALICKHKFYCYIGLWLMIKSFLSDNVEFR